MALISVNQAAKSLGVHPGSHCAAGYMRGCCPRSAWDTKTFRVDTDDVRALMQPVR